MQKQGNQCSGPVANPANACVDLVGHENMTGSGHHVLGRRGSIARRNEPLMLAADVLAPVASRSLFWHTKYLSSAEFLQHLPFAFWDLETCRPRVVAVRVGEGAVCGGCCQVLGRFGIETAFQHEWRGRAKGYCHGYAEQRLTEAVAALDAAEAGREGIGQKHGQRGVGMMRSCG